MERSIYCMVSGTEAIIPSDSTGDIQDGAKSHRRGPCPGCTRWVDNPEVLKEEALIAECLSQDGLPVYGGTTRVGERNFSQTLIKPSRLLQDGEDNIVIGICTDYGSS